MTDKPTDDPLDILDRAHAASTGGEWWRAFDAVWTGVGTGDELIADDMQTPDAAFIVAAHNIWPAVSEELRALREVAEAARLLYWTKPHDDGSRYSLQPSDPENQAVFDALAKLDAVARGKGTK